MDISQATIYENGVQIVLTNRKSGFVFFDEHSGNIVQRRKIDTMSDVQHTGIWLGTSHTGQVFILHNHYQKGYAHLSTIETYALGQDVYWREGECINDWDDVIEIGLQNAINKRPYDLQNYNCQTYTNEACHNSSHSEDVNKWVGLGIGAAVVGILANIFR